jgi:hypothetical protein
MYGPTMTYASVVSSSLEAGGGLSSFPPFTDPLQQPMTFEQLLATAEMMQTLLFSGSMPVWEGPDLKPLSVEEWIQYSAKLTAQYGEAPVTTKPKRSRGNKKVRFAEPAAAELPVAQSVEAKPLLQPPTDSKFSCWDMETCSGKCCNPLHTRSNIMIAKAMKRGELWGDIVDDLDAEEKALAKSVNEQSQPKVGDVVKRTVTTYIELNGKRVD